MGAEKLITDRIGKRAGLALATLFIAMGVSHVEAGGPQPPTSLYDTDNSLITIDGSETSCLTTLIKIDPETNMASAYPKKIDKNPSSNQGPGLPLIYGSMGSDLIRKSIEGFIDQADEIIEVEDGINFEPEYQGEKCTVDFPGK